MKQGLGLVIGLVVGAIGMFLFNRSLPPEEGSTAAALENVQSELKKATRTIRVLEERQGIAAGGRRSRTVGDGMRDIAQDIREGKEVSLDDVFATMKPWMRDMAPLFNRMREINQQDWADNMAGEWARKYKLSTDEKEKLSAWFQAKGREKSEAFEQLLASDASNFVDCMRAVEFKMRDSEGIDAVMEGFLEGEELSQFREDRLRERTESVHEEANRQLARLDRIVSLEPAQQEAVFDVLARSAQDYVPGSDGGTTALDRTARNLSVRSLLRPEQVEALNGHKVAQQAQAEKEMGRMGLSLPQNWDLLQEDIY